MAKAQVPIAPPVNRWASAQYIGGFVALLAVFYLMYTNDAFQQYVLQPIIEGQAWLAAKFLTLVGYQTVSDGTHISGSMASLNILKGCDGIEVTALYLIGVLMLPFRWKHKVVGLLYGLVVLYLLNLLRLVILYLAQVHWPEIFELLHLHGGFALFTIVTILMWAHWALWALRGEQKDTQYATST